MTNFTPFSSLLGGAMLGMAAVLLMVSHGRVAGISGIAVRVFPPYLDTGAAGRVAFLLGLVVAPALYAVFVGRWPAVVVTDNGPLLATAGFLAGFGAVWGNGCTSGHGICGLANLSRRSIAAVAIFMTAAVATVFVMRHLA
jgi:hypothetical protein